MLTTLNASGNLVASSTPTAAAYLATSTTATSTFAGGLIVGSGGGTNGLTVTGNAAFDSTTLFVDSVNDRVGVGTASPGEELQVNGDILINDDSYLTVAGSQFARINLNDGFDTSDSDAGITFFAAGGSNGPGVIISRTAADGIYRLNLGSSLTLGWNSGVAISTTADTAFSRLSAGVIGVGTGAQGSTAGTLIANTIGIGTASPYAKLSVVGPVVAEYFHATSTTATTTLAGGLSIASSTVNILNHNGYVGIGTANPTALLSLAGQQNWITGLGSITHIIGPTDTDFAINGGVGSSVGRNVTISGGTSPASGGNAGDVTIQGGANVAVNNTNTGNVIIKTQDTNGTNSAGTITIQTGQGQGDANGSNITITAGAASAAGNVNPLTGGGIVLTTGNGQVGHSSLATVGAAGSFTLTGGVGGRTTGTSAVTYTNGTGGAFTFTGGAGGASTAAGSGSNVAGAGGGFTITAGAGGAPSGATAGTNTGGTGGGLVLSAGAGGSPSAGTTIVSGNGGDVTISAGVGGTTGTAGVGGVITFKPGALDTLSERFRITNAGLVGIGTTSPYAKLSVVGPVVAEYFHATSTTATTTLQGTILAGSGGNVGIGTITPGAALEVTGNIRLSTGANRTLLVPDSAALTAGYSLSINSGSAVSGNVAGGDLNLTGGTSSGTGIPGTVNITGGSYLNAAATHGGDIVLTGGALPSTAGNRAGNVNLVGGSATGDGSTGIGGSLILTAGSNSTTGGNILNGGAGGAITLTLGNGGYSNNNGFGSDGTGGAAGAFSITGGTGGNVTTAGTGGTGGAGSSLSFTSGNGGNVTTSSGTRTGGNSGNITFMTGVAGTGASANGTVGSMYFGIGGTSTTTINASGNWGFGTSSPSSKLSITQSANTSAGGIWLAGTDGDYRAMYISDTSGVLSFNGGNTGGTLNTATLNEAGAWTNASDISYKDNIVNLNTKYTLEDIMKIEPRFYTMKGTDKPQIGFIAQELKLVIPEVVEGVDGSMGISYGNLAALLVQGIKELNVKVETLAASGVASVKEWVGEKIEVATGYIKQLFADKVTTKEFCIDDLCISRNEFKMLLDKAGVEATNSQFPISNFQSISNEGGSTTATSSAPIITINGNNPAEIVKGTPYADLGAIVTDDKDDNLGIKYYVDGIKVEQISLDTSTTTTYTIDYVATDSDGNTATSTRKVIIKEEVGITNNELSEENTGTGMEEGIMNNELSTETEEIIETEETIETGGNIEETEEVAGETASTTPTE